MGEVLLEVRDLCCRFKTGSRELKAVDGVSFQIQQGEVLGLVGESGSGKTTTGRTIMGIYQPTAGFVTFRGRKICGDGVKHPRGIREIQMVFQDPISSLNPRMTVSEIVGEGLVIHGQRDKRQIRDQVCEMLELVGLSKSHADRYPHEFSGGQRQRIGLARSLILRPELLIADEPVSALDVSVQAQVINLLNDLRRQLGLTVLFIAHDLSVVKYFSHRIGVMYRGKLVELAPASDLFANPMHPYTKALLSAIPQPDPFLERRRSRTVYTPQEEGETLFREVSPDHFVLCKAGEG